MRLFVAVELDEHSRAAIAEEQERLRPIAAQGSRIRWVQPDRLHLTLAFLGEVDGARAAAVIAALQPRVDRPSFELIFAGFGVFPPRGAPRALWIGIREGESELRELQHVVAERVTRLGIALEQRPFSPHLTFGRWKESRPSDRSGLADAWHARTIARTRIDHATLFESRVSSNGPAYTELARATLSG